MSILNRKFLTILRSLSLFGVFAVFLLSLIAPVSRVFADAADPIPASTVGQVVVNGDSTVTVTVNGQWQWTTHNSDCNLDRFGVGSAVDWNDSSQPGNTVGTINGTTVDVGAAASNSLNPADNTVHYLANPAGTINPVTNAPYAGTTYCGTYSVANDYNSGNWGPLSHTYPAGTTSISPCVVTYDIHANEGNNTFPRTPKSDHLVAGGNNHNDDNSIQKNANTPLGNGCFTANIQNLIVVKHVINDNNGTKTASDFTMNVTANNPSQSSFPGSEAGTTVQVGTGAYSVDESPVADYAKTLGAGCSGTFAAGETKICTITNDDVVPPPTLKLVKTVTNDNGGTKTASDFQGKIDGNNVDWSTPVVVTAGQHTASEVTLPSYTASSWGGDCAANGTITLAAGQNATCTITNNDKPPIVIVNKLVSNPYGTALSANSFPLFVDATQVTNGASNTQFNAGNHTVSETQQTGYSFTGVTGDCSIDNFQVINIMLSIGTTSTCTLTNTAIQPKLIVKKHVINDNNGTKTASDFTMTVGGNSVVVPNFPGDEAGTTINLNEGNYSVDELAVAGYTKSLGANCSGTIAIGETKTCTVTNDDIAQPTLTLVKTVTNNNGGTKTANDFQGKIDGNNVAWSTPVTVAPGQHSASEVTLPNYSASSWGGDCATNGSITLSFGQNATCTITNDDIPPSVIVNKLVSNPYGTPLDASLFPLFVDATQVTNGATNTQFNAGSHTVSETQQTGYSLTGISGDCTMGNSAIGIMLSIGVTSSCTLTNTAIQPKLIVKKHVINDNSGTESADDFTMTVSGNSVVVPNFPGDEGGTTINLNEGSYSADELADAGYTKSIGANCSGTIAIGETKTCTITNNDVPHPQIHVVKSGQATAHEGDTVTYTFTVTNTGDTPLDNITVNDNVAGVGNYQSGDSNNDGILQTTETWIYTKDFVIPTPQIANVNNTVTACGHLNQTQVCDTDYHHLDVLHPSIQVVKSGPATAFQGDTVTYHFTVTNTGDIALNNVGIDDDIAIGEVCNDNTLDIGASTTCTATYTIPSSQTADVTNHVIASGTDSLQKTVTDTDEHTLVVLHPSIQVVKSGPTSATPGSTVTYTFTVTNTGNTPISAVTVNDNIAGAGVYQSGDTNSNDVLETTETWIYTAQYTIPADQAPGSTVTNTVTACGDLFTQPQEEVNIDSLLNRLNTTNQDNPKHTVCDQDQHSLTLPVGGKGAVVPPPLVNTGQTALQEMFAGLAIVGMVGVLAVAVRRKNFVTTSRQYLVSMPLLWAQNYTLLYQ